MKKALLMLLLLGGTISVSYAQRGWDRRSYPDRYADNHRGRGYYKDCDRRDNRRYRDRDCHYRDPRVVYVRPYPVVMYPPPPPPPPPRPFGRPRVIITL